MCAILQEGVDSTFCCRSLCFPTMYASTRCIVLVVVALLALSSTLASPYSGSVQRDALVRGTRRMTNAERLARGLPPNKPELRRSRKSHGFSLVIVDPDSRLIYSAATHERRGASATITTTSSSIPTSGPTSGVIKATTGCGNGYLGTNLALRDVSVAGIFEVDLSRDNGSSGPLNFLCTVCILHVLSYTSMLTAGEQNCDSRPGLSLGVAAPDNSFAFVQSDVEVDGSLTLGYESESL